MSQKIFSRTDAYLAYAMRETDTYPAPQSRLDESLIELAETVRLGGASPDVIRQAVNDYLAANPPAGMTDEQIADSVNDSIANGDIQVGTVLTTDQINNINDIPALAEEISDNKITSAAIVNDELVISLGDGSSINAGDVVSDPYVPVVGTVVSVPSTEPAKVTIVNDPDTNESTFNFEIPKGNDGSSPTITQVVDENVLTHALTYDPLTSNEFYAFNCSGLPNTMRYGYCRVNVSQDPLYRDITFKCPTSGRTYVNTIGADPDDPTVLGAWSGWHVSLLEEDVKEYTETEILEMLNLSEVELDLLSNLIDDENISLNKTFSSSKIFQSLQEILEEGKSFTLSAVATKIGASYKVVTSISQMVDTNYIYLLDTSTGYDMYIVDDGGRAVKIGNTQIDLSGYYDKTQVDDKFITKVDADGKYATIAAVNNKVDKDKIVTALDETVTNEQIPGAKAVYDGLKSINDFSVQVVKENLDLNDITETGIYFFPQAYTPVNIPVGVNGWLVVMKGSGSNIVKQIWYRQGTANANSYNTFERYKAGDDWSEWTKFLTEKDYYNALNSGNTTIPENADLNDYVTAGVYTCIHGDVAKTLANCPHIVSNFKLIVNKNRGNSDVFYGYQMIVGTVGYNPVKDVCIYYRGVVTTNDVCVFSKWKIMSGSTVADVEETKIEIDETALELTIVNNRSLYKVINGICYVTIELNVVPPNDNKIYGYKKINTTRLPRFGFSTKATLNAVESNSSISAVLDKGDTFIKLHGNILAREGSCIIQGSFSYPVAE